MAIVLLGYIFWSWSPCQGMLCCCYNLVYLYICTPLALADPIIIIWPSNHFHLFALWLLSKFHIDNNTTPLTCEVLDKSWGTWRSWTSTYTQMLDRIAPPFVFILSNIVIYDPCQTTIQTSPSSPNQAVDKSSEPILFPEDEDPDVTITFVSDAQLAVIAMLPTTALLEPAIVMGAILMLTRPYHWKSGWTTSWFSLVVQSRSAAHIWLHRRSGLRIVQRPDGVEREQIPGTHRPPQRSHGRVASRPLNVDHMTPKKYETWHEY